MKQTFSLALLAIVVFVGCEGRPKVNPQDRLQTADTSADVFVAQALEMLHHLEDFEPVQAQHRVVELLNRWLDRVGLQSDWQRDPLVDRLPGRWVDRFRPLGELGGSKFVAADAIYLQSCVWANDIAVFAGLPDRRRDASLARYIDQARQSISDDQQFELDKEDDQLAAAMKHLHSDLNADGARDLAAALRLFDWSVRNIQLDQLLPYPQVESQTTVPGATPDAREEMMQLFPQILKPGPGYQHLPTDILLNGHGDAWERARVLIVLGRQMGIDVVMLALQDADATSRPREWLPAAYIQGQLFLFDTELGLPLPGPQGRGIATLDQVLSDPQLLRSLDIEDDGTTMAYRITADDQQQIASDKTLVLALIDAPAAALSQRIQLLEDQLTSADKMVLAVRPSLPEPGRQTSLENNLLRCRGISQVRIWTIPFEAAMHAEGLPERLGADPDLLQQWQREQMLFGIPSMALTERNAERIFPLVQGRIRHFRGEFTGEGTASRGALSLYREARQPRILLKAGDTGKTIEQNITEDTVETNEHVQQFLGIPPGVDNAQRAPQIETIQQALARGRAAAGYWMALAHFDSGSESSYSSSASWLERQIEWAEVGSWADGCRYNLARACEVLGQDDKARALYLADESPQRAGNLLRAQTLESVSATATGD